MSDKTEEQKQQEHKEKVKKAIEKCMKKYHEVFEWLAKS